MLEYLTIAEIVYYIPTRGWLHVKGKRITLNINQQQFLHRRKIYGGTSKLQSMWTQLPLTREIIYVRREYEGGWIVHPFLYLCINMCCVHNMEEDAKICYDSCYFISQCLNIIINAKNLFFKWFFTFALLFHYSIYKNIYFSNKINELGAKLPTSTWL